MSKPKEYNLRLSKINVLDYSYNEKHISNKSFDEIIKNLLIDTKTTVDINEELKVIIIKLKIEFRLKDVLEVFFEILVETTFDLSPFEEIVKRDDAGNIIITDDSITNTLLGLSFSTSRGIVFERLRGSILQGVVLPVIDPKMLLSNH
ncbi:hypothetical protein ACNR9Q_00530 [Maribacter sp. X9]|uniref:hypothetical protein n=1 Tax=Maribacter sp. X9 TaxID=3402159 RepID=UPI003AF38F2F